MGTKEQIVGLYCDYPGCRLVTYDITSEFVPYPGYVATSQGWERWVGRRRMDYCPGHAKRPKAKGMRRIWPAGDGS